MCTNIFYIKYGTSLQPNTLKLQKENEKTLYAQYEKSAKVYCLVTKDRGRGRDKQG